MLDELPSEPSGCEALADVCGVKSRYSWVLLWHRGQEAILSPEVYSLILIEKKFKCLGCL